MARLNKVMAIKLARQPERLADYLILGPTCPAWLPGLAGYCWALGMSIGSVNNTIITALLTAFAKSTVMTLFLLVTPVFSTSYN